MYVCLFIRLPIYFPIFLYLLYSNFHFYLSTYSSYFYNVPLLIDVWFYLIYLLISMIYSPFLVSVLIVFWLHLFFSLFSIIYDSDLSSAAIISPFLITFFLLFICLPSFPLPFSIGIHRYLSSLLFYWDSSFYTFLFVRFYSFSFVIHASSSPPSLVPHHPPHLFPALRLPHLP